MHILARKLGHPGTDFGRAKVTSVFQHLQSSRRNIIRRSSADLKAFPAARSSASHAAVRSRRRSKSDFVFNPYLMASAQPDVKAPVVPPFPFDHRGCPVYRPAPRTLNKKSEMDSMNLTDVVRSLRDVFAKEEVNTDDIKAILRAYKSNPKDWQRYTKFDPTRYTRNLLDGGNGKYNVIILCWSEGQGSAIHAHSDSHCFVKVLDGQITESQYAWPEQENDEAPMKLTKKSKVDVDDVSYINDSIGLHRMENTSHTDTTVTLHVYVPAYHECLTFDERSGHRNKSQMVFHTNSEGTLVLNDAKPVPCTLITPSAVDHFTATEQVTRSVSKMAL